MERLNVNLLSAVGAAAAMLCGSAVAAPVVFFGEDVYNTNVQIAHPHSDTAKNAFLSNLTGVGTETFEGIASGATPPITLTFPGAGTATLNGSGSVSDTPNAGRYGISGTHYYTASSGSFNIQFGSPIAAFGFYAMDIGDYGATLSLSLTDTNNNVTNLAIPNTVGSGGSTNGSVLYLGFYDTTTQYKNIAFVSTSTGGDTFGFDDMTIGALSQVTPNATPEPGSLALAGAALVAAALSTRRRKVL